MVVLLQVVVVVLMNTNLQRVGKFTRSKFPKVLFEYILFVFVRGR